MTTTVLPAEPVGHAEATARALRTPAIAASLLPVEVVAARRARRVRRIVLVGLVLFVGLLGGWYVVALHETNVARSDLAAAEQRAQELQRQQQEFDEVIRIEAESATIRAQLGTLLADDLQWSEVLATLRGVAPTGIRIDGVTGALTTGPNGPAGPEAGHLPSSTEERSVGVLTITGSGPSKAAVAGYVDALGTVPGLANPWLNGATDQEGRVQFTVRVDITSGSLGGRYTPQDTSGKDGP